MKFQYEKCLHPDFKQGGDIKTACRISDVPISNNRPTTMGNLNDVRNDDAFRCFVLETKLAKMCDLFDALLLKTRAYKKELDALKSK
ncbi:MAG: hypothetical protein ACRDD8_14760 [Bacteroidales bacterium]